MEENQQFIIEERLELAAERIHEIAEEPQKQNSWGGWMKSTARYLQELLLARQQKRKASFSYHPPLDAFSKDELLLAEFLTEEYEDVARSAARGEISWLTEFSELFLQLYGIADMLADSPTERCAELKETVYWFYSDYSEDAALWLAGQLFDETSDFICYIGYEPESRQQALHEAENRSQAGACVRFFAEPLFAWSRGLRQMLPACVYTEPFQASDIRKRDSREAFFADPRYISRKIEAFSEAFKKYPPKKAVSICFRVKETSCCQKESADEAVQTEYRFSDEKLIYHRLEELDRELARILGKTLQIEQRISIQVE